MKRQKRTIVGVFLTLMLLGSLVAAVAPVSASTLDWGDEDIPDTGGNVLEAMGDTFGVLDLAVYDEDIIYAAGGAEILYKSSNGGETWSSLDAESGTDVDLVAVAPDDPDIVAYADTDTDEVYISTNGGSSFGALSLSAAGNAGTSFDIRDLVISTESSGKHYIAVAGEDDESGPIAEVWTYDVGDASPVWDEISNDTGFDADDGTDNSTAVALAYSPNFAGDQVLLVLTASFGDSATADQVLLEIYSENSDEWNDDAGFTGYAADIVSGLTDLTAVTAGSLALDPEYLGSDDAMRTVFVGLALVGTSANAESGIYRMDDDSDEDLKTGATYEIHSVAYDGTNLIVGSNDDNYTYYSDDPTASSPTVSTTRSLKRPGGESKVVVAWAGSNAVAGTYGDESAFAISTDLGKTYNDVSLIDTDFNVLADVQVSADGSIIYLLTVDTTDSDDVSLWRSASSWQRVLSLRDEGSSNSDWIIRLAPDDSDVVYIVDQGSKDIWYSKDSGMERWQKRASRYIAQDLAVEGDGDVAYVIIAGNGEVSKTSNSGFTWGSSESTGLDSGYSIRSLGEDLVIAGSGGTTDGGYVAYSSDGNSSWDDISTQLADTDNVSVVASGLADDDFIYATTDDSAGEIERWKIGSSSSWKSLQTGTDFQRGITLVDGILYSVGDNELYRSINPTSDSPSIDYLTKGTINLDRSPQALRTSAGSTKLWALDSNAGELLSLTDTLVTAVPTLVAPAQDFAVKVNPITGRAVMVSFIWLSPSDVDDFDIEIAFDADFDEVVLSDNVGSGGDEGDTETQVIGPYATGDFALEWTFDTTYFWKVRVKGNEPFKSGWSEVRRFTIEEAAVQPTVVVEIPPAPPAPNITVTPPDVIVNIPPVVTVPPAPAPITPAWIWVIVIIGGVLVIALIVLIVRTRRAV